MPVVERVTFVAAPIDDVFACALRADLPSVFACGGRLLGSRGVAPGTGAADSAPGVLRVGDVRVIESRIFWLPRRATVRLTEVEPGRWVREHRTSGPLRVFQHERYFETVVGGTRVLDVIAFRARFGPLGRWIEKALLCRRVARFAETQAAALRTLAEAPGRHD